VASLPTSVDPLSWAPTSRNQGALGSCVTWAIDYGMLGWYERHDRGQAVDFNPMYTFAQVKQADGHGRVLRAAARHPRRAMQQGQ